MCVHCVCVGGGREIERERKIGPDRKMARATFEKVVVHWSHFLSVCVCVHNARQRRGRGEEAQRVRILKMMQN